VAEALNLHGSCAPHVAGRNSVGDTFAVFADPQHVLAAVPDLQNIAALGRALPNRTGPLVSIPDPTLTLCGTGPYTSSRVKAGTGTAVPC